MADRTDDSSSEKSEVTRASPLAPGGRHIHRRADVALRRCCRKAEIREISWHKLRHTTASTLANRGRTLLEIMQHLGHKDFKSTLRYAHLMPETQRAAAAALFAPAPEAQPEAAAAAEEPKPQPEAAAADEEAAQLHSNMAANRESRESATLH